MSLSLLTVTALAWRIGSKTSSRYGASDLPLAFWAWKDELPSQTDVDSVRLQTGSNLLFARAGQLPVGYLWLGAGKQDRQWQTCMAAGAKASAKANQTAAHPARCLAIAQLGRS